MDRKGILLQYIQDEFVRGRGRVTADEDLLSGGILNSLGILQLVAFIEERFNILVPDEDVVFENFQSVSALSSYLDQLTTA
jgi:acyl carrier protein